MIKATKLMTTGEPDFAVDETKHKYGTKVDWMDCDANKFIDYWLPIFDTQNGINAPPETEQPYRPVRIEATQLNQVKRPMRRKIDNAEHIKALVAKTPMTVAEIATTLNLGSAATAHKAIVNNPAFQVVAEKRVGKNPYVKVWGLR